MHIWCCSACLPLLENKNSSHKPPGPASSPLRATRSEPDLWPPLHLTATGAGHQKPVALRGKWRWCFFRQPRVFPCLPSLCRSRAWRRLSGMQTRRPEDQIRCHPKPDLCGAASAVGVALQDWPPRSVRDAAVHAYAKWPVVPPPPVLRTGLCQLQPQPPASRRRAIQPQPPANGCRLQLHPRHPCRHRWCHGRQAARGHRCRQP